ATTGQITVANSAALDYETTATFALLVQVTDNGTPSLSATTSVTVNLTDRTEERPVGTATLTRPENSPNGTSVGKVAASDPDAGQSLTFAILSGNTSGAFTINPTTGQISVANSAALDYETTATFALLVQVTDNGTPSLSATTSVNVNLTD